MPQAAFSYGAPDRGTATRDGAGPRSHRISIFADRAHLRGEMRDDAEAAGLQVITAVDLGALVEDPDQPIGDVVLLDCPLADPAEFAALSQLDERAARSGIQVIVSTTVDALDAVFACMDQSRPQILVAPARAERVVALGGALARLGSAVRELSEEDRLAVLRLTEQVGQIAQRLDRLVPTAAPGSVAASSHTALSEMPDRADKRGLVDEERPGAGDPPLPDPKLVRRVIRQRQLRGRFIDPDLFADPAWDMLLDLTAATAEKARVSVSSLCIAAAVPPTTALRWIRQMTDYGLLARIEDDEDRRRAFITLTERSTRAMASYFAELGDEVPIAA